MTNMDKKKISIGKEDFKDLIIEDNYYIDKSLFIKELIQSNTIFNISLFLRPRRFGKTLTLSMLKYFFDLDEKANASIFDGLAISKETKLCVHHQNKYPVIFITFKDLKGSNEESFLRSLNDTLKKEYKRHSYLLNSIDDEIDKQTFTRLLHGSGNYDDYKQYLSLLSEYLYLYHHVKPIVLIDEYDVPLNAAHENNYFEYAITLIREMFSRGLKTNQNISGGVITGCLQIAKNQIFTGLNNLSIYSVLDPLYSSVFGFTKEEVRTMLSYYGLLKREEDVKQNYDGYFFGEERVYNPFSILNFISRAISSPSARCESYWSNSSGDALLKEMLLSIKDDAKLKDIFETLLSGRESEVDVDVTVTYDSMTNSFSSIMGTLLFTGYLTAIKALDGNSYLVKIPNREVLSCFKSIVKEYNDKIIKVPYNALVKAFINGDSLTVNALIDRKVSTILSFNDFGIDKEYAPHLFLLGSLSLDDNQDWMIESQREEGDGRPDISLFNYKEKKAIIIEIKYARKDDKQTLDDLTALALAQIEREHYDKRFLNNGYSVVKWGIGFKGKNVEVVRK